MLSVQAFSYEDKNLRTVMVNGEPWFVGTDACRMLGIGNPNMAMSKLRVEERVTLSSIEGALEYALTTRINHNAILVNESGLYRLIMRSRKPGAKRFQDWVFCEVLPTLRRTGSYTMEEQSVSNELVSCATDKEMKPHTMTLTAGNMKLSAVISFSTDGRITEQEMYGLYCMADELLERVTMLSL